MVTEFRTHVHPETYSTIDPLELRALQVHTSPDQCELSMCTFKDCFDWAQTNYADLAQQVQRELNDAPKCPACGALGTTEVTHRVPETGEFETDLYCAQHAAAWQRAQQSVEDDACPVCGGHHYYV